MITFSFQHDAIFSIPEDISRWIESCIRDEEKDIKSIHYIFCTDDFMLPINQKYLSHDDYTDVITFPYQENPIEGEIYISLDRVLDNAKKYNKPAKDELLRVCIHGVLHLCGYADKTEGEKFNMRKIEDKYLQNTGHIRLNLE